MALKSFVKLSSVNNLSDARYGAGMGVDMMGFQLDTDSDVSIETFKEITSWVEGPMFVAEFRERDTNRMLEVISACHPDAIEVSHTDHISELSHINTPVILRWSVDDLKVIPQNMPISYLLIDSDSEKRLSTAQKSQIRELCQDYKVLLGTGVYTSNLTALFEELPIAGISLKGGTEIRAGYKDYDELADILELLEED
jgi:phosphoribosylanthranilate isomerase